MGSQYAPMDSKVLVLIVLVLFYVLSSVSCTDRRHREPLVVADSNWTQTLEGEWMIEFMAPWCPACRAFKEAWAEFAGWGYDLDISVGVIDVTENPVLSGRFLVTSLPTIYHVKEGVFRHYYGSRKTTDLISVIDEKKWQEVIPVAWYRDPNSIQMGIVGSFFKTAMFIRGVYNTMTDVYGIPEWACYVIFAVLTIVTGLLLGLLLVVCCDSFFPAKYIPLPPERLAAQEVAEDDTDIIDDTEDVKCDNQAEEKSDNQSADKEDSEMETGIGSQAEDEGEVDVVESSKDKDASQEHKDTHTESSELRKRLPHKDQ